MTAAPAYVVHHGNMVTERLEQLLVRAESQGHSAHIVPAKGCDRAFLSVFVSRDGKRIGSFTIDDTGDAEETATLSAMCDAMPGQPCQADWLPENARCVRDAFVALVNAS